MSFEFTSEIAPVEESIAAQEPAQVFDAALEALRFELAHAEASRSRAAGMLTATGVLLAAGVLSGLVFAPARRTRTPVEEMRSCPSFASANQTRKSWSPARSGTCPCPDRPTSVPARGS
jgi:hypothetical protein